MKTDQIQHLCQRFKARSEALWYTGKRRDNSAIDFFAGAAQALPDNSPEQGVILFFTIFKLAIDGYAAILEGAKDA